jgi:glycosyltransferase involved in cell wall biosynthesis
MRVLFVHQAFPAQFGRLALELNGRHGWECRFLVQNLSSCPLPSKEMLDRLPIHRIDVPEHFRSKEPVPWSQSYGRYLDLGQAVLHAMQGLPADFVPDLIVSHDGLGPSLFMRERARCPIVHYCEYYFAPSHCDISYRIDLPPAEPAPFYPRCINAATLIGLVHCDGGYCPTHWQRQSFPRRFWPKIEVHFDGIDEELYKPGPPRPELVPKLLGGRAAEGLRVVTFVARGLESMRGFDLFMRLANRICQERPNIVFVVVGQDNSFYGWDRLHVGQSSFRSWVLAQDEYDLSRFVFHEHLTPDELAELFRLSDLHLYLTVPFVPSWSLFNALASGCVVLASDVAPVREVIEPGNNGLVEPLFDTDRQLQTALRVLDDPAAHRPLGQAGRRMIEEKYGLEVCIPPLRDYFERMAGVPR